MVIWNANACSSLLAPILRTMEGQLKVDFTQVNSSAHLGQGDLGYWGVGGSEHRLQLMHEKGMKALQRVAQGPSIGLAPERWIEVALFHFYSTDILFHFVSQIIFQKTVRVTMLCNCVPFRFPSLLCWDFSHFLWWVLPRKIIVKVGLPIRWVGRYRFSLQSYSRTDLSFK